MFVKRDLGALMRGEYSGAMSFGKLALIIHPPLDLEWRFDLWEGF